MIRRVNNCLVTISCWEKKKVYSPNVWHVVAKSCWKLRNQSLKPHLYRHRLQSVLYAAVSKTSLYCFGSYQTAPVTSTSPGRRPFVYTNLKTTRHDAVKLKCGTNQKWRLLFEGKPLQPKHFKRCNFYSEVLCCTFSSFTAAQNVNGKNLQKGWRQSDAHSIIQPWKLDWN